MPSFEAIGGRKFFGLFIMAALMVVVEVFGGKLSMELSGGLVALYVAFVGGNAFATKAALENAPEGLVEQAAPDMSQYDSAISVLSEQVAQANNTAEEAGKAVLQLNQQMQGLRNLAAIAAKGKANG